jgi:hypothetical protein
VLDAFLVGRAVAQTLNERLGRAVGALAADVSSGQLTWQRLADEAQAAAAAPEAALASLTRADAELREELRAVQDEALARARDARTAASATAYATGAGPAESKSAAAAEAAEPGAPTPKQLRAVLEELRAEVAALRAELAATVAPEPPTSTPPAELL